MHVQRLLTMTALIFALVAPGVATAATTDTIALEGRLTTSTGKAVSDGDYGLSFSLYDSATSQTPFWQEKGVLLGVKGGWFKHTLGSKSPISAATLASKAKVWIALQIGAEPELTRQRFHSVTSALVAGSAASIQCTGCIPVSAMKFSDNIDLGNQSLKAGGITATTVSAATVQAQTFVGDGSKLSGLKLPAGSCASGKVLVGINADGTLKCATTAASLPKDGLDEISNGVLKHQFVETFTLPDTDKGKGIPDATGVDLVSTIKVPNIGSTEQFFKITVDLVNSDLSQLSMVLLTPSDKKTGITLCDPCGKKYEKVLKTTFPTPQAVKSGDLKAWIGKNPAGTWNLKITDTQFCVPQLDKVNCNINNSTDGKLNHWSISTQVLSNSKVQVVGDLVVSGKLLQPNAPPPKPPTAFPAGSTPILYGFQTDRLYRQYQYGSSRFTYASQVPQDNDGLHRAVRQVRYADVGGNIIIQRGGQNYQSYDDTQQVMVVFIKNTTGSTIKKTMYFYYSSRSSGSNYASLALNGSNVWNYTSHNSGTASASVSFPPNKTSVLVLKTGGRYYTSYGNSYCFRNVIGFYNNSLKLPTGLSFDYARYAAWQLGK
ncbi:MAG: hypothetical protein KC502_09490 [Myxococcales bacterium]|nr:hypothetical protein [Myxococcales bacterium]